MKKITPSIEEFYENLLIFFCFFRESHSFSHAENVMEFEVPSIEEHSF